MGIKDLKPKAGGPYRQGYFRPKHPEKYVGASKTIIYRSGMEYKFCILCDTDRRILEWASEPFHIPYYNPIKKRPAKYYPDYYIKVQQRDGTIKTIIVEVKPQAFVPQKPKRPSKFASKKTWDNYHYKLRNIVINEAKRKAAVAFCAKRDAQYMYVTETFFDSFK